MQLRAPGFLSNKRQHRQCGMAVLEMAQQLQAAWQAGGAALLGGAPAVLAVGDTTSSRGLALVLERQRRRLDARDIVFKGCPDARAAIDALSAERAAAVEGAAAGAAVVRTDEALDANMLHSLHAAARDKRAFPADLCPPPPVGRGAGVASAEEREAVRRLLAASAPAPAGSHAAGFRDTMDVAVRWRQLSEPNDPVWWIDLLDPKAFEQGFGLQTPMVRTRAPAAALEAVLQSVTCLRRSSPGSCTCLATTHTASPRCSCCCSWRRCSGP